MGYYRGLYEDYYKGIDRGDEFYNIESRDRTQRSSNYRNTNYRYRNSNYKKKGKSSILNVIAIQTIGALSLLLIISALKHIPNNELNNIYSNAKEAISYNQNFEDLEVVEAFNEIKDKITNIMLNESSYDDKVEKVSLLTPVIGTVSSADDGVIIKNKGEKDVFASLDGQVKEVKLEGDKVNIVIDHKNGYETYYENISNPLVKEQDNVEAGECIGTNTKVSDENYEIKFKISYMGKLKDVEEYMNFNENNV